MVHYSKLVVYRNTLCLYYSTTNKSYRHSLNIPLGSFNSIILKKIKKLLLKGQIPDELGFFREEITIAFENINKSISQFKIEHGKKPSIEEFKDLLQKKINVQNDLKTSLKLMIEHKKKEINVSPNTLKIYKNLYNRLDNFEKSLGTTLNIYSFDFALFSKFYGFIRESSSQNLSHKTYPSIDGKTISRLLVALKTFLTWLNNFGTDDISKSIKDFEKFMFHTKGQIFKITKDVKKYSLNPDQVKSIINFPEKDLSKAEIVYRDIFIVLLHTGLRVSDFFNLDSSNFIFDGDIKYIAGKSIKTSRPFKVEISDFIIGIFQKYDFKFNKKYLNYSRKVLKTFLKKIPEFNCDSPYFKTLASGVQQRYKLYEIMTFHQGRRSFITNMSQKGFSPYDIMRRTGHTHVSTVEKYISPKEDFKIKDLALYD
jgi:integrase